MFRAGSVTSTSFLHLRTAVGGVFPTRCRCSDLSYLLDRRRRHGLQQKAASVYRAPDAGTAAADTQTICPLKIM